MGVNCHFIFSLISLLCLHKQTIKCQERLRCISSRGRWVASFIRNVTQVLYRGRNKLSFSGHCFQCQWDRRAHWCRECNGDVFSASSFFCRKKPRPGPWRLSWSHPVSDKQPWAVCWLGLISGRLMSGRTRRATLCLGWTKGGRKAGWHCEEERRRADGEINCWRRGNWARNVERRQRLRERERHMKTIFLFEEGGMSR